MSEVPSPSASQWSTLVELVSWRARVQPEQIAYTFLLDGETEAVHLTYAELDRQARSVGARLQQLGLSGTRALLLYPPGLAYVEAFFGCLYAGVVAVPAYPPQMARLERTLGIRLRAMIQDAQVTVALTTASLYAAVAPLSEQIAEFKALQWLVTDTDSDSSGAEWQAPNLAPSTLALLQYTSGSTATPKGVMLGHGNLLHNLAAIHRSFQHSTASRGVIWLPPYHDMGLIGGLLQPLYGGFPVTLMAPMAFLQRPLRWLQAISRMRATTSGGPNFAYDLCVRKIPPEQRAGLDLSSWEVAFNGAEPIRAEVLERFYEAFGPYGFRPAAFYPCYGLAEATLLVSGSSVGVPPVICAFEPSALEQHRAAVAPTADPGARVLVGCGQPATEHQVVIVRPDSHVPCAPGEVGEIWVAGASVAQG